MILINKLNQISMIYLIMAFSVKVQLSITKSILFFFYKFIEKFHFNCLFAFLENLPAKKLELIVRQKKKKKKASN